MKHILTHTRKNPLIRWFVIMAILMVLPVTTLRAATMLKYGQSAAGSLNAGQLADYTFAGKTGDKPVITMNAHSGSMMPYIALYDPQNHLIGEDINGGPKGNALLKGTVLPADGVYKITLTNKAQTGDGKYTLFVNEVKHQVYFDGGTGATGSNSVKQAYQLTTPWNHTNITYHLINTLSQFNPQDVKTVMARALQAWGGGITPLTFTEVAGRGDINIQFSRIDGTYNILGETCPPGNPCAGDVTFDSAENWTLGDPQDIQNISLLGVASHEFGHAIGLLHTNDANALMYPEYSPYNLQPGQDDISGVQRLYGLGSGRVTNPTPLPGNPPSNNGNPYGQMQVSGQLDNQHYAHFWDFDAQAGDTVTITMKGASGDLDAFLVLLDANNHVIAFDDDSGGDKDAQLRTLKFPQGGTYTVAATRYAQAQGNTTGAYSLSIQYDVGSGSVPTIGSTPVITSSGSGSVKVSAGQAAHLAQLPSLDSILATPFANSAGPGSQARSGTLNSTQSYVWDLEWCATDAKTLSTDLKNIVVKFTVDNQDVAANLITQSDVPNSQLSCAKYFVILSNWTLGTVEMEAKLTLKQAVFDGQTIFPPGDYVYQYNIQVMPGG